MVKRMKRTKDDRLCDIKRNLPDDVIDKILMCLPTQDAVRTSILSRNWRYSWTKIPQLILDETLWNNLIIKHSPEITYITILVQFLMLHKGPINKFTLSLPGLKSCPEIDSFILFILRNGIKDLTIKMPKTECYKLPLSFLNCHQLQHLSLESCLIKTLPTFEGFSNLITLKLCEVSISNEALGRLISNSPMLEVLDLKSSSMDFDLEIDVPNLKTFKFEGLTKKISFIRAPLLASLSFVQCVRADNKISIDGLSCNVLDFFHGLPVIEYLDLHYSLVQSLAEGGVPRRLHTSLVFLKYIILSNVMLHVSDELSIILCLMRNSPNLECIDIKIYTEDPLDTEVAMEILKEEENSDVMLNELKEVKLMNITGTIVELEFIKLLLTKSPTLREISIQPGEKVTDKGCKILTEVTKFCRASKDAKIIYEHIDYNQG